MVEYRIKICAQAIAREVLNLFIGIKKDEEIDIVAKFPSDEELKNHKENGDGPDANNFKVQWDSKRCAWNLAAFDIFYHSYKEVQERVLLKNPTTFMKASKDYVENIFFSRIERLARRIKESRPRQKEDGGVETAAEVNERKVRRAMEKRSSQRPISRRQTVCYRLRLTSSDHEVESNS